MHRPILIALFALALVLVPIRGAAQSAALVRGRIVESQTGDPVAGAVVRLTGAGLDVVATTTPQGEYAFASVAGGEYRLRVLHPGYEHAELRVVLRPGSAVTLDVPLVVRPVPVAAIDVQASRDSPPSSGNGPENGMVEGDPAVANRTASFASQAASALADMVAADVVREPPADRDGGRRVHVLYIWGSSVERGRVLLDGAALNAPLHLGGMLPPLDPDLLAGAELRGGGISPRYDGGTTYIMDFATRPAGPGVARTWGEFDLLTGRLGFELPLGESGGVMVGGRRVNAELVDALVSRPFGYGYADVLARADVAAGERARVHATALATRETIRIPRDQGADEASWQNLAASVGWQDRVSAARRSVDVSVSRGIADLPLLSAPGGHLEAVMDRISASAEQRWRWGAVGGTAGVDVERLRFGRTSRAAYDVTSPVPGGPVACTASLPCVDAAVTTVAAYGEAGWQPGKRVAARAGVRLGYRPDEGDWDVLPRASVSTLLGETGALTLSVGRFSQTYAAVERENAISGSGETPGNVVAEVGVARATHVELRMSRRSERSALTASAFVRHHEAGGDGTPARRSPGFDVSWTYAVPGFSASLGYSIARVPSTVDLALRHRTRHLGAAGIGLSNGPIHFQLTGAYGRGLPYTSLVLEDPAAEIRAGLEHAPALNYSGHSSTVEKEGLDHAFFRLDAVLGAEWRFRVNGREVAVLPYAKIFNALSHREALFYYHDAALPGEPRSLVSLPAIPVIGVRWEF